MTITLDPSSWLGKTLHYDSAYRRLGYPNDDLPIEIGVCTDVIVRALRASLGIDLQTRVHQDMKGHFSSYPQNWGLKKPDRNIDHRRVPKPSNLLQPDGRRTPSLEESWRL